MAVFKINRKATTPKGFLRRVADANYSDVDDPREQPWVRHPLEGMLKLGVLALASGARSTRAVENRRDQLHNHIKRPNLWNPC